MSNDPYRNTSGGGSTDDLQFDRVEPTAAPPPGAGLGEPIPATATMPSPDTPGVTVCGACNEPITDTYYESNGKVVCPRCREAVMASQAGGSRTGRFLRATVYGVFAGIVGAAIWYGVRAGTGYEVGLIAILVGFLVGGAVKAGAKGRGGIGYQLLAVVLTYLSIAANYAPDIVQALRAETDVGGNPIALVIITAVMAVAAPFLGGMQNIIGILIIGFALFQAWVINKSGRIAFNGPYRLAPAAPGGMPAPYPYGAPPPPPPVGQA